jgi:hypothetical protein
LSLSSSSYNTLSHKNERVVFLPPVFGFSSSQFNEVSSKIEIDDYEDKEREESETKVENDSDHKIKPLEEEREKVENQLNEANPERCNEENGCIMFDCNNVVEKKRKEREGNEKSEDAEDIYIEKEEDEKDEVEEGKEVEIDNIHIDKNDNEEVISSSNEIENGSNEKSVEDKDSKELLIISQEF